jgi:hypothetical protein
VVESKELEIGNLTDLLDSNSDNARLAKHAERLKSRREGMLKKVSDLKTTKASIEVETRVGIEKELSSGSTGDDIRDAEKRLAVAVVDLRSAEAELADIETLLAATEELISKNERLANVEGTESAQESASLWWLLPWTLVVMLSVLLLMSASLQVCQARLKVFRGYKDMPDAELPSVVGPGPIGTRS